MTTDDYKALLALLLPPVSYNINGERLSAELNADTGALSLADAFIADLLTAIDPREATNLLSDWERVYALAPAGDDNLQQRRQRVMGKLAETGGLSREYFINLARALGYTITITEHETPRWEWDVNVQGEAEQEYDFRVDESVIDDYLMDFGDPGLETMFERLKPAHTRCVYKYSGAKK
ncbi:YmfQ family protein [Serratia liquefaciens]|uniref:YmfQ family protein n=1 Tax=Serratia liquefaciens TaxID=614 RepID=UPI003906D431